MRMRDRQSVLAALLLLAAYDALLLWTVLFLASLAGAPPPPAPSPALALLLSINLGLLVWRLAMRTGFVTRTYGWREGLRSVPRVIVGNAIAMLAARRALMTYLKLRRTGTAAWDKIAHFFPRELPAE